LLLILAHRLSAPLVGDVSVMCTCMAARSVTVERVW